MKKFSIFLEFKFSLFYLFAIFNWRSQGGTENEIKKNSEISCFFDYNSRSYESVKLQLEHSAVN